MRNYFLSFVAAVFLCGCSSQVLKLSFIGDVMAHDVNFNMKDFSVMYENVAEYLLADDLTFGNLEFPIDNSLPYSTYPNFNVHSEYVEAVINAGVDVFSLANNHSNDQGISGVLATLNSAKFLQKKYDKKGHRKIYFSGIRKTAFDGLDVQIICKNNLRIAFVAVTEILNLYDESRHKVQLYYYNKEYRREFAEKVAEIKERTMCDLLVLSVHTAEPEYVRSITDLRREYFRKLAESGADIIWAHHPHVVQAWEKYAASDNRETLIMYSMGNFISGQRYKMNYKNPGAFREYTGDSYILKVDVLRHWQNKKFEYRLTPIQITTKVDYSSAQIKLYEFNKAFIDSLESNELKDYYITRFNLMKEQLGEILPWEKIDTLDK